MKKNFALLMVVVIVLGFAACDKQPVKKIGEALTIDDTPIKELWRGVVTGNVKTFGPWGIIEVASPADDQDHRFEMCVILREVAGPASVFIPERIKVGTEIYFSKHHVSSTDFQEGGGHCDIGLIQAYADGLWAYKEIFVMNPPKK